MGDGILDCERCMAIGPAKGRKSSEEANFKLTVVPRKAHNAKLYQSVP